jgi:alanine racemase
MTDFRSAIIDLAAVGANLRRVREIVGDVKVLTVVKADAYGHGAVEVARTAVAAGADYLGTADLDEALALRAAGIEAPILCWLHGPDVAFDEALDAGIEIGVSSASQLERVAAAASRGRPAVVQLKLETGLSRNGASENEWDALFARAQALESDGLLRVHGLFTHVSNTSPDEDRAALACFERGIRLAAQAGLRPVLLHAAATAAAIDLPESRYDMIRLGVGLYGLSPFDDRTSADLGLVPVMRLSARVAAVRTVDAGAGVSYNYMYRTEAPTRLALVPLGYADGIPRHASNRGPVWINGRRYTVAGRVAMDQFVVDVGSDEVAVGDEVVLFGAGRDGEPTADDWAEAADTINYEIVTRIGPRVRKEYRS